MTFAEIGNDSISRQFEFDGSVGISVYTLVRGKKTHLEYFSPSMHLQSMCV